MTLGKKSIEQLIKKMNEIQLFEGLNGKTTSVNL